MSTINESIEAAKQFRGSQITAPAPPAPAPSVDAQPGKNAFLRTPLPTIWKSDPDALRHWSNSTVPQTRIMTPVAPVPNAGNVSVTENAFIAGGGSGGGSSSTNVTIDANTTFDSTGPVLFTTGAVVTTPVLSPGARYVGSTLIANTFQLCSITASSPCRVQLYGSAQAQQADAARGLDDPCSAGVFQNLITDVALDAIPYQWNFQDRCASNNEEPQNNTCYVTITNLDKSSDVIFINIQYVALSLGNNPGAPVISLGSLLGNTPISNTLLSTWGNVAQLTGAVFSGPVSTNTLVATTIDATTVNSVDINASGSIIATVIQGDVDAVSITASGSIVATDISATSSISTVDITASNSVVSNNITASGSISAVAFTQASGSTSNNVFNGPVSVIDITGNNFTVNNTLNGFLPPAGDNANNTLDKVITQNAFGPASSISGFGVLTIFTFTVTAHSTSDVFNLQAAVSAQFPVSDTLQLYGYVDGTTRFGYGQTTSQNSTYPQSVQFFGSVTGLASGSHTISLTTYSGGIFPTSIIANTAYAILQQIAA